MDSDHAFLESLLSKVDGTDGDALATLLVEIETEMRAHFRRAQLEAFFAKLEPCLIGIEACATAHHWARTFEKMGH